MPNQPSTPRYGRLSLTLDGQAQVDRVRFTDLHGNLTDRPVFDHQPVQFKYDHHGYEEMVLAGQPVKMVRFTPKTVGEYTYQAFRGDQPLEDGRFECLPSDHPGYVQISPKDPRYFAFTNGESFCVIGVNLCMPPAYPLPQGMEHFEVGKGSATLGLREYRRWFRLMAENGGNFTRIWLSGAYLQAETETAGEVDPILFNRLDGIIELARENGIRLKLCFDHFRAFRSESPVTRAFFMRHLTNPHTGEEATRMDDWLVDPVWQDLWFHKVQAYLARYGGDPVIMAWELWNEMDCVETSRWELVREWTRTMLARIKATEPDQLVVQSLGSFDDVVKRRVQDDLIKMPEMDFQQVHRYLDQGAPWAICNLDPVAFSISAINETRRQDRPVLLAETGAVNDRHTGPFRYYRMDNRGMIFHDTTFPAFFAGAAGTGQNWWWDSYVDQKNLWGQLKPLANLLKGVKLDQENLQPVDLSNEDAWCLALKGKGILLAWVRSKADSWQTVLRDECRTPFYKSLAFPLHLPGVDVKNIQWASFWPEQEPDVSALVKDSQLIILNFRYAVIVRIDCKLS